MLIKHPNARFICTVCIRVGSDDPVRVLRLFHNKYTGYNWNIYCWDYVQLVTLFSWNMLKVLKLDLDMGIWVTTCATGHGGCRYAVLTFRWANVTLLAVLLVVCDLYNWSLQLLMAGPGIVQMDCYYSICWTACCVWSIQLVITVVMVGPEIAQTGCYYSRFSTNYLRFICTIFHTRSIWWSLRVLRLFHNKYTGYNWSIYCWDYVQLVTTKSNVLLYLLSTSMQLCCQWARVSADCSWWTDSSYCTLWCLNSCSCRC